MANSRGERDAIPAELAPILERLGLDAAGRCDLDHADSLAVNDGVALFAGPGGIPVICDFEGVSEVIGDLSGRGPRRKGRTGG